MTASAGVNVEPMVIESNWTAEIYRDWEFPEDVLCWWQHAADQQGDVGLFVSPGWLEQWWSGWGSPGKLFTIVLRQSDRIQAIFPCHLDLTSRGDEAIRSLGGEVHHDPLAEDGATERLVELIHSRFRHYHLQLDYLSTTSAIRIEQVFRARKFPTWIYTEPFAPYIDVDGSWDDFVSTLPSDFVKELRRKRRRLERDGPVTQNVHSGLDNLEQVLSEAFEVEARGWKGQSGIAIQQRPDQERYIRNVCRWAAKNDKLRLVLFRHRGKLVAFDISFLNAGTVFLLETSFDEEAARRYSPSHLMRFEILRQGFEEQAFRRFNFLGRCYAWKQNWARQSGACHWVTVYPGTIAGRYEYVRRHAWKETLKRAPVVGRVIGHLRAAQ
jgi:CelD/BcsL family acetyltransferase involved in cellulose biosynthesis